MSLHDDTVQSTKHELTIFFVIDVSGSMEGLKIGAVNTMMEELIPEIREIAENSDVQIKIAVILFSSGCQRMYPQSIPIENFTWKDIYAEGATDLGAACFELNKMSEDEYSSLQQKASVIFLMMDGSPTDNYHVGLGSLKNNKWFANAVKVAIAIGDEADKDVLAEFTGSKDAVIETKINNQLLRKAIESIWGDWDMRHWDNSQMIFNHLMKSYQKVNHDSGEDKKNISKGTMKNAPLSILITDDDWGEDINAEVLSISPLRNYVVCKSKMHKNLLIAKCSDATNVQYRDLPFFFEIVNVPKITWHESESYFEVYYDSLDEDQSIAENGRRSLRHDIYCYAIKNYDLSVIEFKSHSFDVSVTLAEPDKDEDWL